jgi:Concanavalin A-like lectin/glucanases superfamily/TGF-beta propeptide
VARSMLARAAIRRLIAGLVVVGLTGASVSGSGRDESAAAAAGQAVEVVELRSATSQTFVNVDGTLTTSLYSGPIHYRDASGEWHPISSRLIPSIEPGYAWRNEAAGFRAYFKSILDQSFVRLDVNNETFRFTFDGATPTLAETLGDGALSYEGAMPGVDLRYAVRPDGIKETLTLANANVPTNYRFFLTPPEGMSLEADQLTDGSWAISAADGDSLFTLDQPWVSEAGPGGASPDSEPHASLDVTHVSEQLALDIVVDAAWLASPDRQFPVVIDPTVTIGAPTTDASFKATCVTCPGLVSSRINIGSDTTHAWRGALKFDLSDVPTSAVVTDARFRLYFDGTCLPSSGPYCGTAGHQLNAHRFTQGWSPSSSTGSLVFDSTPLTTFTLPAAAPLQWMSWTVTSTVQAWLAGTQPNHGLLVKRSSETLNASGPRPPAASFGAEPTMRPKLDITYSGAAVDLLPITALHSTGAELAWTQYSLPFPFSGYEVHRSPLPHFTPTTTTRIATIANVNTTSYVDTTASAKTYSYKIVTNTSPSNERTVTLTPDGQGSKILQPQPQNLAATKIVLDSARLGCENYGSSEALDIGTSPTPLSETLTRRVLVGPFDLSGLSENTPIHEANLSLFHPATIPFSATIDVHRLTRSWTEGTGNGTCTGNGATWLEASPGAGWVTEGGDFATEASATLAIPANQEGSWNTWNLTSLAEQWVNGEVANYGALLKFEDETQIPNHSFYYHADDFGALSTVRPKLDLAYDDGTHASYEQAVSSDLPRAYWRLGDAFSAPEAADSSGNGFDGWYGGGVEPGAEGGIEDNADTAATFSGTEPGPDVFVDDAPGLNFGAADFTVEAWISTTENGERAVVGKRGTSWPGWEVTVTDDLGFEGRVRAVLDDGSVHRTAYGPSARVDDGAWHHIVVVFARATGTTVYVDRIGSFTPGPATGSVSNAAVSLRIGGSPTEDPFIGDIDEVAVYPFALSASRARANFAAGMSSPPVGYRDELVDEERSGHWRFDEEPGATTAVDSSGNGNSGIYRQRVTPGQSTAIAADPGHAANFAGTPADGDSEGFVDIGDRSGLDFGTNDFSVEAWVKTTLNEERSIVGKTTNTCANGPNWHITVTDDSGHVGQARARICVNNSTSLDAYGPTIRIDDGAWHHVAFVFQRDLGVFGYVDGVEQFTAGVTDSWNVSNDFLFRIGKGSGHPHFNGDIDEVAAHPFAQPPDRIVDHYEAGVAGVYGADEMTSEPDPSESMFSDSAPVEAPDPDPVDSDDPDAANEGTSGGSPGVTWSTSADMHKFKNADGRWTIFRKCFDRVVGDERWNAGPGYIVRYERPRTGSTTVVYVNDYHGRPELLQPGAINAVNGGLGTFGWHHTRGPVRQTPAGDDPTTPDTDEDPYPGARIPPIIEGRMCANKTYYEEQITGYGYYRRKEYGPVRRNDDRVDYTMDVWFREGTRKTGAGFEGRGVVRVRYRYSFLRSSVKAWMAVTTYAKAVRTPPPNSVTLMPFIKEPKFTAVLRADPECSNCDGPGYRRMAIFGGSEANVFSKAVNEGYTECTGQQCVLHTDHSAADGRMRVRWDYERQVVNEGDTPCSEGPCFHVVMRSYPAKRDGYIPRTRCTEQGATCYWRPRFWEQANSAFGLDRWATSSGSKLSQDGMTLLRDFRPRAWPRDTRGGVQEVPPTAGRCSVPGTPGSEVQNSIASERAHPGMDGVRRWEHGGWKDGGETDRERPYQVPASLFHGWEGARGPGDCEPLERVFSGRTRWGTFAIYSLGDGWSPPR